MTISRFRLVDASVSRWYHGISRCVRRAMLLESEAAPGRKDWIENRSGGLKASISATTYRFSSVSMRSLPLSPKSIAWLCVHRKAIRARYVPGTNDSTRHE